MSESMIQMQRKLVDVTSKLEKVEAELAEAQATLVKLLEQEPAVPEEWREKLITEFPLFNDEGLCQEKHHCEWALQQDRKRLHAMLQSALRDWRWAEHLS